MNAAHRFALRVYYEDTDLSGIVYHANYLRWFERARSDLLRLLGIDQREAIDDGWGSLEQAVDEHCREAAGILAARYRDGRGLPRDASKTREWARVAARLEVEVPPPG